MLQRTKNKSVWICVFCLFIGNSDGENENDQEIIGGSSDRIGLCFVYALVCMFLFWNLDDVQEISGGSSERIGLCFVQLSPESVATCSASSVLCSTSGKSGLGKYSPAAATSAAPLKVSTV